MECWERERLLLERARDDPTTARELLAWISNSKPNDATFVAPGSRADFAAFFMSYVKTQTQRYLRKEPKAGNSPKRITKTVSKETPQRTKSSQDESIATVLSPVTPVRVSADSSMRFSTPETERPPGFSPVVQRSPVGRYQNSSARSPASSSNNDSTATPASARRKKTKFLALSMHDPAINKENAKFNYSNDRANLDFADDQMYPAIGAKKDNARTRRIKPTRLNMTYPCAEANYFNGADSFGKRHLQFGVKYDKVEQNDAFKVQNCLSRDEGGDYRTERDILRREKGNIIEKFNELSISHPKSVLVAPASAKSEIVAKKFAPFSFDELHDKSTLDLFSNIFALLLDNNLVSNVTSEIYYLVSLAILQQSIDSSAVTEETNENDKIAESVDNLYDSVNGPFSHKNISTGEVAKSVELFDCVCNCVYFALATLERQKFLLEIILDKNCINHFANNDRVNKYSENFAKYLTEVYNGKIVSDSKAYDYTNSEPISSKTVCFIADTDNAENFPSIKNFHSFKSQRDSFYEILRLWESKHQSPGWRFDKYLGPKVRSLIAINDDPSNLAHLARLFKDQLLTMCTKQDDSVETLIHLQVAIGANRLDKGRINKLAQRLTEAQPTNYNKLENGLSSRPEFTICEDFFRDFILHSMNTMLREHLINALVQEICKLNDSNFSMPDRDPSDSLIDNDTKIRYLSCIRSLRILAKFLGFILALPYNVNVDNSCISMQRVLNREMVLRNEVLPPINLIMILYKSQKNGRLILTVPWIVQMLAMLDYTSLRISYFKILSQFLFEIYVQSLCNAAPKSLELENHPNNMSLNDSSVDFQKIGKSSILMPLKNINLLRLCLGWLFDLEHFPQDYLYSWLVEMFENKNGATDTGAFFQNLEMGNLTSKRIDENAFCASAESAGDPREDADCYGERTNLTHDSLSKHKNDDFELELDSVDIIDEKILKEVCPFLKEFRSLILHTANTAGNNPRNVRHITPVTSSFHGDKFNCKNRELQLRLEEWFLQSQPGTTRQILDLVSERIGSALVRLAKAQVPDYGKRAYEAAKLHVSLSNNKDNISASEITEIYKQTLSEFHVGCKKAGNHISLQRVSDALKGLLAPGTPKPIFDMCSKICSRNALRKLAHSLKTQYGSIRILMNDTQGDVTKIISSILDRLCKTAEIGEKVHNKNENKLNVQFDIEQKQKLLPNECLDPETYKKYDEVHYSCTTLLIEYKELLVNFVSGKHTKEEIYEKNLLLLKNTKMCCRIPYVDKQIKDCLTQMSLDALIYLLTIYPESLDETYLTAAKHAWQECLTKSGDNLESKSAASIEIEQFRKMMLSDENVENVQNHYTSVSSDNKCENSSAVNMVDTLPSETSQLDETMLEESDNYFNTVVCSRNLMIVSGYYVPNVKEKSWAAYKDFLIFLMKNNFLAEDSFVEQCVAIFREEWPQVVLDNFSKCIKGILAEHKIESQSKLDLMLDFLSSYCENLDDDFSI